MHRRHATIHREDLAGDVLAGVGREQQRRALQVFIVADALQRRALGKILGAEMYGTSSSDDKLARVKDLGLQNAINYKERDYEEAIKEMTGGEGVDAAFEMLGGEHTAKSIRCLRDFGKVIQYGTATGKQPQLDLRALYAKAASVQGLWLTYLSSKHDLMEQAWKHLSQWIAEDKLQPVIGHVVAANEAAKGYELLMARKNFGKVVLKIA